MDDLELLAAAVKATDKQGGLHWPHSPTPAEEAAAVWKRQNRVANEAYAALYARACGMYNVALPDKSARFLLEASRLAHERGKTFASLSDMLRWFLSKIAALDEQCKGLVDTYISLMGDLVAQSYIVVESSRPQSNGGTPPGAGRPSAADKTPLALPAPPAPTYTVASSAGYTPKPGVAAAPELTAHIKTVHATIEDAQTALATLEQRLAGATNAYVLRQDYDALLGEWNATQKRQHDRDDSFVMDLIQIILDVRALYGVSRDAAIAEADEGPARFQRAVDAMTSRLELALSSQYGITRIPREAGAEYDPQIMMVEKSESEPAPDTSLVGRVARVEANGYWRLDAEKNATIYQRIRVVCYGAPEKQRK
jgi:hypothetical protein